MVSPEESSRLRSNNVRLEAECAKLKAECAQLKAKNERLEAKLQSYEPLLSPASPDALTISSKKRTKKTQPWKSGLGQFLLSSGSPDVLRTPSKPSPTPCQRAVRSFVEGVTSKDYDADIKYSMVSLLQRTNSLYDKGTDLAKTIAIMTNVVDASASMWLFFFLSSLALLVELEKISTDQADEFMAHLGNSSTSFYHRRRSLSGALWFHRMIISNLSTQNWDLGHAIGVVAISGFSLSGLVLRLIMILDAPRRLYLYDSIASSTNVKPIVDALQTVEQVSKQTNRIGWTFFDFVTHWDPSLG
jgi:hypothetical protein